MRLLTLLLALLLPLAAYANPPKRLGKNAGEYTRVPFAGKSSRVSPAAATETYVKEPGTLSDSGIVDKWCVPFRSTLEFACTGAWATFCFVQTGTVSMNTTIRGQVSDAEGSGSDNTVGPATGAGYCFKVLDGVPKERIVPTFTPSDVTYRSGVCDDGNADSVGMPCDDDAADCGSGGTCVQPTIFRGTQGGCAMIVSMGDGTTAPTCDIENTR